MTEQEMRDSKVPTPRSAEEVSAYIEGLRAQQHDYGTCVYAMSMAATAAFNYMAGALGVTGFQASCADMDILRRTRQWEWGKLLNYEHLLYPQYCNSEHFPSAADLLADSEVAAQLKEMAAKKLAESDGVAAASVLGHWQRLVDNPAVAPSRAADAGEKGGQDGVG